VGGCVYVEVHTARAEQQISARVTQDKGRTDPQPPNCNPILRSQNKTHHHPPPRVRADILHHLPHVRIQAPVLAPQRRGHDRPGGLVAVRPGVQPGGGDEEAVGRGGAGGGGGGGRLGGDGEDGAHFLGWFWLVGRLVGLRFGFSMGLLVLGLHSWLRRSLGVNRLE